ncbi:MAG: 3-hydroxyacyl-CoA dehydrogenase [Pseudomonadota bacterium]
MSADHASILPIGIVGAGMIGMSWAICFARAGHPVRLYDSFPATTEKAMAALPQLLRDLSDGDLLHDALPDDVLALVSPVDTLEAAVLDAYYVQENTPEKLDIKKQVFSQIDATMQGDTIIGSSTSALMASQFTLGMAHAARCMVVHPLNPPHLIPAVEIVPHADTDELAVKSARDLMASIGQKPIVAALESEGFIMNRLQGALLDEAFKLHADGVASVADIDTAMSAGLARRWLFMGPFETIDLNAPGGISDFIDRYGPAYERIGQRRSTRVDWQSEKVKLAIKERRDILALDQLGQRQNWRDACLARISSALHKIGI